MNQANYYILTEIKHNLNVMVCSIDSSPRFQFHNYVNTLWTQALYIFPFMPKNDAPRAFRIGNNASNLA